MFIFKELYSLKDPLCDIVNPDPSQQLLQGLLLWRPPANTHKHNIPQNKTFLIPSSSVGLSLLSLGF
jgi:hypothetical protein